MEKAFKKQLRPQIPLTFMEVTRDKRSQSLEVLQWDSFTDLFCCTRMDSSLSVWGKYFGQKPPDILVEEKEGNGEIWMNLWEFFGERCRGVNLCCLMHLRHRKGMWDWYIFKPWRSHEVAKNEALNCSKSYYIISTATQLSCGTI